MLEGLGFGEDLFPENLCLAWTSASKGKSEHNGQQLVTTSTLVTEVDKSQGN